MFDLSSEQIEIAVIYLSKRQLQGRPTTLRQLGKRMSMASSRVLDAIENVGVRYVLVPHENLAGRVVWGRSNTEVVLRHLPDNFAKIMGIQPKQIEDSFVVILGDNPEPVDEFVSAQEQNEIIHDSVDPFAGYRISKDKYEVLKNNLITFEELVQIAREKGYSVAAIRRATGGDKMRLPLPSFFWRPYVVGNKRYYLKDVIDHLVESDRTYRSRGKLDTVRRNRLGEPENNKFIQFSTRKRKSKKDAPRKREKQ